MRRPVVPSSRVGGYCLCRLGARIGTEQNDSDGNGCSLTRAACTPTEAARGQSEPRAACLSPKGAGRRLGPNYGVSCGAWSDSGVAASPARAQIVLLFGLAISAHVV